MTLFSNVIKPAASLLIFSILLVFSSLSNAAESYFCFTLTNDGVNIYIDTVSTSADAGREDAFDKCEALQGEGNFETMCHQKAFCYQDTNARLRFACRMTVGKTKYTGQGTDHDSASEAVRAKCLEGRESWKTCDRQSHAGDECIDRSLNQKFN